MSEPLPLVSGWVVAYGRHRKTGDVLLFVQWREGRPIHVVRWTRAEWAAFVRDTAPERRPGLFGEWPRR